MGRLGVIQISQLDKIQVNTGYLYKKIIYLLFN